MKRGIIVAIIAIVLVAILGILLWNILEPGIEDHIKEECRGDPEDYDNCIGREKLIEDCYEIKDLDAQTECFDNSTYNGLEEPEVEITTGRLSE